MQEYVNVIHGLGAGIVNDEIERYNTQYNKLLKEYDQEFHKQLAFKAPKINHRNALTTPAVSLAPITTFSTILSPYNLVLAQPYPGTAIPAFTPINPNLIAFAPAPLLAPNLLSQVNYSRNFPKSHLHSAPVTRQNTHVNLLGQPQEKPPHNIANTTSSSTQPHNLNQTPSSSETVQPNKTPKNSSSSNTTSTPTTKRKTSTSETSGYNSSNENLFESASKCIAEKVPLPILEDDKHSNLSGLESEELSETSEVTTSHTPSQTQLSNPQTTRLRPKSTSPVPTKNFSSSQPKPKSNTPKISYAGVIKKEFPPANPNLLKKERAQSATFKPKNYQPRITVKSIPNDKINIDDTGWTKTVRKKVGLTKANSQDPPSNLVKKSIPKTLSLKGQTSKQINVSHDSGIGSEASHHPQEHIPKSSSSNIYLGVRSAQKHASRKNSENLDPSTSYEDSTFLDNASHCSESSSFSSVSEQNLLSSSKSTQTHTHSGRNGGNHSYKRSRRNKKRKSRGDRSRSASKEKSKDLKVEVKTEEIHKTDIEAVARPDLPNEGKVQFMKFLKSYLQEIFYSNDPYG